MNSNLILNLKNLTQNYAIFMKAFNTFSCFAREGISANKRLNNHWIKQSV